jgi:hypothetical protein
MKLRIVSIIGILVLVLAACQQAGDTGNAGSPGKKSQEFAYIFDENTNPINTTVTLETATMAEALISTAGGTLSVKGKDGTNFTLEIPADALLVDTTIRMTPVASLSGLPFGSPDSLAVQLEPEGLFLNNFATLTITPAQEIPIDQQIMFGYLGSGQDVILVPPVADSREIKLQLLHFSGYGVTKGLLADIEPVRQRIGGSAERRLQNLAAERLGVERQGLLLGTIEGSEGTAALLEDIMDQFEEEVIQPRIAAAGTSCAAGQLALQTVLGFERQKQLLGFESEGMQPILDLMDVVGPVCVKEEFELCKNDHVIHRMIPVWLGMRRQHLLLGGSTSEPAYLTLAKELTEKCLSFDLIFESQASFDAGGGDGYDSSVTSTIKLKFNGDMIKFTGDAPLVNTDFNFRTSGCSVTSIRGGSTFQTIDFGYKPQENIPEGTIGTVIDLTLIYYPGNTTESFTVVCEDQPPFTSPPSPMWTGVFLVTHQFEMDQAAGGFVRDEWEILGKELYAQKDWVTTYESEGLLEAGTFKLYHRPQS